jgi:hypothetical protein
MIKYNPLPMPEDSAWDRFTIRKYLPTWLKSFIDGTRNVFKWLPTIYKDRDWDQYYIYKMLQQKLYFQREYLVKHNRHMGVAEVNRYITICLNLIERIQEEYYACEYIEYETIQNHWIPSAEHPDYYEWKFEVLNERYDEYFSKYKNTVNQIKQKYPDIDKHRLVLKVSSANQIKCQTLLFKILNEKIGHFWD